MRWPCRLDSTQRCTPSFRHGAAPDRRARLTQACVGVAAVGGWEGSRNRADPNVTSSSMIFQNTKKSFDGDKVIYFTMLEFGML